MNLKKFLSVVTVLLVIFTFLPHSFAVITNLTNTPVPNTTGSNAEQKIRFVNTVSVPVGGRIEITFPTQFDLISGGDWTNADVTLHLQGGSIVSDVLRSGQKISIGIGGVASGTGFQEIILSSSKVVNPPTAGLYTISLTTLDTQGRSLEGTAQSAQFEIVSNMTPASVIVEPNTAGAQAKYTIRFKLGSGSSRSLYAGDKIKIEFDTNLPSPVSATTIPGTIQRECVKVNNISPTVDPSVVAGIPGTSKGVITVILSQNISSTSTTGADVVVIIDACGGILNPTTSPWERKLTITTMRSSETIVEGPVDSNSYLIKTAIVSPAVLVKPDVVGLNAEYHIKMKIGENGTLFANSGRIDVTFPVGTYVPTSVPASSIRISVSSTEPAFPCSGTDTTPYDPLVSGNKVSFVTPKTVNASEWICIQFTTAAGLKNPVTPGNYSLKLSTSAEPSIVSSQSYTIRLPGRGYVTVTPNTSSKEAEYQIIFTLGVNGAIYPSGTEGLDRNIMITFPPSFTLPATIAAGSIQVNGFATSEIATITGQKITFPTPVVLDNNAEVTVKILKQAGIKNPDVSETPSYYSLTIETDKEKDANKIITDLFTIISTIDNVSALVSNPGVGVVSRYEISFTTGDVDSGLGSGDTVTIEFPSGTIIPSFISTGNVRLQNDAGLQPSSIYVSGTRVVVTLPTGFNVAENMNLKIIFFESAGIRNPEVAGSYRVTVYTSKEPTPVSSSPYFIGTVAYDVSVTVEPNYSGYCSDTGEGARYSILFVTGASGGLSSGQKVHVVFSPEYSSLLPASFPIGTILINGLPSTSPSPVNSATSQFPMGSKEVLISMPLTVSNNAAVQIEFLPSANVDNPAISVSPQPFYLYIYTDSEPSSISGIYNIVSVIKGIGAGCNPPIGVILTNDSAGSGTGVNISFKTGPAGTLTSGVDRISIKFPPETRIPSFISGAYITINTADDFVNSKGVLNPSIIDTTISFVIPYTITIGSNTNVYIYISQGAGIVNPSIPGNYRLYCSSSKEPIEIASVGYSISAVGISRPTVSPLPTLAGATDVQYTVRFTVGSYGNLNIGDTITFEFPFDTTLPASILPQYVLVNGSTCSIAPFIDTSNRRITIYSPVYILGNSSITVVFTSDAHIKNPTTAGTNYILKLWTLREGSLTNPLQSDPYEITPSDKLTKAVVGVYPCTPYSSSRYTIEFYTPIALTADISSFVITFPNGTFIPSIMSASNILFSTKDNSNVQSNTEPSVYLYEITVYPPFNIQANSYVKIDFLKDAGLQNPQAGNYTLTVRVGAGGATQESYPYYICPDLNFGRLEILPPGARISLGKTQIFSAQAYDANGKRMDYGVTYKWSVTGNVGVLSDTLSKTTEFYARNMGSGNISVIAEYGSKVISASASIVVVGTLDKVSIIPSSVTIPKGKSVRFSGEGYDINGERIDDISFDWYITPSNIGTISKVGLNEAEFVGLKEGSCTIKLIGTQSGITREAEAQVIVKTGVNSLQFNPQIFQVSFEPSVPIGPLTVSLVDVNKNAIPTSEEININVSSSSSTTRFSLDGIEWTKSNSITLKVSINFSETLPFYVADLEPSNITIIAVSTEYNSAILPISIRGNRKTLQFSTPPRSVRASVISEEIKVSLVDSFGNLFNALTDTVVTLSTTSKTGSFSKSTANWEVINRIVIPKGENSTSFFYMDTNEGTYTIFVTNPLFGTTSQLINIAPPGSVSSPEVTINPAITGVMATYTIKFIVGIDGSLISGKDFINIYLPEGTKIPQSLPEQNMRVNDVQVTKPPIIDTNKLIIIIISPVNIGPGESVTLSITGIYNPDIVGNYTLKVSTSVQTSPSESLPYRIDISSITNLKCQPKPIIAGTKAEYLIQFNTGLRGELSSGDEISIIFDYEISVPDKISKEFVYFNGIPLTEDPVISGKLVTIKVNTLVKAETSVNILFKIDVGLVNPLYPGKYSIKAYTSREQVIVNSELFEIVQTSVVKDVKVSVKPPLVSSPSEYNISFTVGPYGALITGDFIFIIIPDASIPPSINGSFVSVNNILVGGLVSVSYNTLKIPVNTFIAENTTVSITILRQAGILNPSKEGSEYRITVFTTKEPYPVISEPYIIEPQLVVNYILDPITPNGLNEWYITPPTLIFITNINAKIYYSIDFSAEKEYTAPISLDIAGVHTVSFRAVSLLGSESSVKSFTFKYDGTSPEINTNIPDELYTKNDMLVLSLKVTDISNVSLTLNDVNINLINNAFTTQLTLKQGENLITIRALDEAGNSTSIYKKIILKTNPPILVITNPSTFELVEDIFFGTTETGTALFANVRIKGSTEIGVEYITVTSNTVAGFTTIIPVNSLGDFDKIIGVRSVAGDNFLSVSATDKVGNTTNVLVTYILKIVIRLRIGSAVAYTNGNPVNLDVKPYLKYNQHTMVPFRFIAESLGAEVKWEEATRKVSYSFRGIQVDLWIGKKNAEVTDATGKKRIVTLLAEPEIVSGRTLVPLRFVSEAMGAKVDWDPKLWEAIISFPQ